MKRIVKLTENDLSRIVRRVIKEQDDDNIEDFINHLGNNRSKTLRSHVIHVENEKNKIKLEVRHRPSVIENKLKICADIAINVLTEYFNPSSILFLGNSRTLSGYHKYVKKIITNLKTPIPLRSTRKIHQTKGNICTIINTI